MKIDEPRQFIKQSHALSHGRTSLHSQFESHHLGITAPSNSQLHIYTYQLHVWEIIFTQRRPSRHLLLGAPHRDV